MDDIQAAVDRGRPITAARARLVLAELNKVVIQNLRLESRRAHYAAESQQSAARALALEIAAQNVVDCWRDDQELVAAIDALARAITADHDHTPLADLAVACAHYRLCVQHGTDAAGVASEAAALQAIIDRTAALYGPARGVSQT